MQGGIKLRQTQKFVKFIKLLNYQGHFKDFSHHLQLYSKQAWSNFYQFLDGTGLIFIVRSNVSNCNFQPECHMFPLKTSKSVNSCYIAVKFGFVQQRVNQDTKQI
jgi:hypothetical protein